MPLFYMETRYAESIAGGMPRMPGPSDQAETSFESLLSLWKFYAGVAASAELSVSANNLSAALPSPHFVLSYPAYGAVIGEG